MPMQAHADAMLFVSKRPELPQRRQDTAGSEGSRLQTLEKPEVERDAFASYNHKGTVAVAIIWLAIYVIAAAQPLLAWSLSLIASL